MTIKDIYDSVIKELEAYSNSKYRKYYTFSRNDNDQDRELRRTYAGNLAEQFKANLNGCMRFGQHIFKEKSFELIKRISNHEFNHENTVHVAALQYLSRTLEYSKSDLAQNVPHLKSYRGIVNNLTDQVNTHINCGNNVHGKTVEKQQKDLQLFLNEEHKSKKTRSYSVDLNS
ncbi:hypothetical protein ACR9PT_13745 [Piscirickettsia salmonis]|uniref:hypothetical protein n=1 Tax=Piscirickettsia salmonis TaxID=1238 RepID=UPI003EBC9981